MPIRRYQSLASARSYAMSTAKWLATNAVMSQEWRTVQASGLPHWSLLEAMASSRKANTADSTCRSSWEACSHQGAGCNCATARVTPAQRPARDISQASRRAYAAVDRSQNTSMAARQRSAVTGTDQCSHQELDLSTLLKCSAVWMPAASRYSVNAGTILRRRMAMDTRQVARLIANIQRSTSVTFRF